MHLKLRWRLAVGLALFAVVAFFAVLTSSCAPGPIVVQTPESLDESGLTKALIDGFVADTQPDFELVSSSPPDGSAHPDKQPPRPDVVINESPAAAAATSAARFYSRAVLIGASGDVAGAAGARPAEALARIAVSGEPFYAPPKSGALSALETLLWKGAGVKPSGPWYLRAPDGVAGTERQTVATVRKKVGYALVHVHSVGRVSDRDIVISFTHPSLGIAYSLTPAASAGTRDRAAAEDFVKWVASPKGRKVIESFGDEVLGARQYSVSLDGVGLVTGLPGAETDEDGAPAGGQEESLGEHDPDNLQKPSSGSKTRSRKDLE